MNLVQINERLKEMPVQALQQYANGSNPMVPPYLALGEIQRREKLKQQMAMGEGASQGQPSIKEQIEQKAGLLGLQQAQLAQQQQQMMQPQPGPVPAGVPQPMDQPEEGEVGMATGGLATLRVPDDMYQFAEGGIIAFQEGGQSPQVITVPRNISDEELARLRQENPNAIIRPEPEAVAQAAPAQAPGGIASVQRSPLMAEAVAAARQMPEKPTAESVTAGINALLPPELQEEARQRRAEEAKARMAESVKAYEGAKPSGLDQLIKVFGQAGQYKGLSGLAPAYTQNREQMAAADADFRRQQEAMRSAAEKQQLQEATGMFEARTKDYSSQMEGYRRQLAGRIEALAGLAGADQRAIDAALGRMNDAELTKLRIAADRANAMRPGAGERITAQVLKLRSQGKTKDAEDLLDVYSRATMGGAAGVGAQRAQFTNLNNLLKGLQKERENATEPTDIKRLDAQINQVLNEMATSLKEEGGGEGKKPTTKEEYDRLPKGATYVAPDGTTRIKG